MEALLARSGAKQDEYAANIKMGKVDRDTEAYRNKEVEIDAVRESVFGKGTSNRIYRELYKVLTALTSSSRCLTRAIQWARGPATLRTTCARTRATSI